MERVRSRQQDLEAANAVLVVIAAEPLEALAKATLLYLGFILRGRFPGKPGQDALQQGGDFVVDVQGILRLASATQRSHDRPPVDTLMARLRAAAQDRVGPGFIPGRPANA